MISASHGSCVCVLAYLLSGRVTPLGTSRNARAYGWPGRFAAPGVRKGTFRQDLFYRLNGVEIWLPPFGA